MAIGTATGWIPGSARGAPSGSSDGELLGRFETRGGDDSEAAFRALVERHGPMVRGVCRRVLGDAHDAEDASQATFLILARKGALVRDPERLGNWLYGVAYRVAARARARAARRREREARGAALTADGPPRGRGLDDLHPEVREEVRRLPEKYRAPIILCYLEGKTNEQAARQLHCPVGTVKVRLMRARERLRSRLARLA